MLGRGQWFVRDDWSILHPDTAPIQFFAAHQGHWNTAATVVFQALRDTVGMHSYLPYLAIALLAHLAVVHLLWRIMIRTGVSPWMANGFAGVLIVFGAAAQNLLSAFQMGFMGAIAVGLAVLVLVDRPVLRRSGAIAAVGLSIVALTFSGTALPVIAAALTLSIIRRGWLRSIALFAPAGIVYVVWYLLFSVGTSSSLAPYGLQLVTRLPLFFAAMFGAGYGQFVGLVPLGVVIAVALAIWVIRRHRSWVGDEALAYALLLGSAVFAALTAASRSGGELTAAGAQRYVYVIVALAVPAMALALGAIASRGRALKFAAIGTIALVAAVNAVLLIVRADEQAVLEQQVERQVSAALDLLASHPELRGDLMPVPDSAPDLTVADLRADSVAGVYTRVPYTDIDREAVRTALGL